MGGSGSGYKKGNALTSEELKRRHRKEDSDAYLFDVEYEKLKKEQEKAEREYEQAREQYMRLSEELREEMENGTITDASHLMAALTNRGVQLQQEQEKMSAQIDELGKHREDVENKLNELRKKAFSGSTHAYESTTKEYDGFKYKGNEKAKVVEMTPVEYLRRVAFDVKGEGIDSLLKQASTNDVDKYARQMLRGIKLGAPSINSRRGVSNGDEKVWAALLNGYSKIPVLVYE